MRKAEKKSVAVPIHVVALGTMNKNLENYMKLIGVVLRVELLRKRAPLGIARLIRKVIWIWWVLLSSIVVKV